MYCLNMMVIALELAKENPAYEGVASKFLEHFVYISRAMNNIAGQNIELWDRTDGFYYDVLRSPDRRSFPMRVRSMVGLIPLFAVETLESELIDALPGFKRRMQWFIDNLPEFSDCYRDANHSVEHTAISIAGQSGKTSPGLGRHAGRIGVSLALRHPLGFALSPGTPLHSAAGRL